MVDTQMIINAIVPMIQILVYAVLGIIILGGTYYYLYHILGQKKWNIRIYELRENGKLNLVGFDILQQKRIMQGKRLLYWLKRAKVSTIPPSQDIVQKVGRHEYADYIKIDAEVYAPMPTEQTTKPYDKGKPASWVEKYLKFYKKSKQSIKTSSAEDTKNRFIYIPANRALKLNLKYDVSYDVDMMRMNAIDLRDLMWNTTRQFWEKYGTLIVGGLMLVAILAIAVLSYEHIEKMMSIRVGECSAAMKDAVVEAMTNTTKPLS